MRGGIYLYLFEHLLLSVSVSVGLRGGSVVVGWLKSWLASFVILFVILGVLCAVYIYTHIKCFLRPFVHMLEACEVCDFAYTP